ncbi:hypothetical protein H8E77_00440 [bacterium]|nr:hypothetical protein [bacterium]
MIINKKELIEKAYTVFSIFRKPKQCTKHTDFEDAEFNSMLLSATRRSLTIEQVGTVAWGPIPSMIPEALAYFMPRFIELAVTKTIDRDGDPFFCYFTNTFHEYSNDERYRLFGPDQKIVMADTFDFLCQKYREQLKFEGWLDMAQQAENNWSNT